MERVPEDAVQRLAAAVAAGKIGIGAFREDDGRTCLLGPLLPADWQAGVPVMPLICRYMPDWMPMRVLVVGFRWSGPELHVMAARWLEIVKHLHTISEDAWERVEHSEKVIEALEKELAI